MEIYYLNDTKWCGWNEHIFLFVYGERDKKYDERIGNEN